jgi:hypothetical protein
MPRKKRTAERGPNRFRRTEVTRLAKAAIAAGIEPGRIEVDPVSGKITLIPANHGRPVRGSEELDRELEDFEASHEA